MSYAVLLAFAVPARGEIHCAAPQGAAPELARIDVETRLRFIDRSLQRSARNVRAWAWSWASIYTTLSVVSFARLAGSPTEDEKIDLYLGGAAPLLGVAVLAIAPQRVLFDQRRLSRRLRARTPADDACAILADAERWLDRDVAQLKFGRGPLIYAGTILFNAGLMLLAGVVFDHWDQAAIFGLAGTAVGVVQIVTLPGGLIDARDRYRAGRLDDRPARPARPWLIAPQAQRNGAGVSFQLAF